MRILALISHILAVNGLSALFLSIFVFLVGKRSPVPKKDIREARRPSPAQRGRRVSNLFWF